MAQNGLGLYTGNPQPADTYRDLGQIQPFTFWQIICPKTPQAGNFIDRLPQFFRKVHRPVHQDFALFRHLQAGNIE